MAGGSVIRGRNGWKVDNGQRLFSFGRNRSGAGRGGGSRRKDSQHSRFFALKYFCSSEKLKNPAAFVELPPSSLSLSLYESSLTLEKRRERERLRLWRQTSRSTPRKLSLVFVAFRTNPRARSAEFSVCMHLPLCIVISQFPIYIYIYIYTSKQA